MSSSSELVATARPRGRVLRLGANAPVAALPPTVPPVGALPAAAPAPAVKGPRALTGPALTAGHPFDVDLMARPVAGGAGAAASVIDEAALLAAADEAYEAGYRRGAAEALEQARAERDALLAAEAERTRAVCAAVARAAAEAAARIEAAEAGAVATLAEAALALARAVIGRELTLSAHPGLDAVVRALTSIPATGAVLVRMNPADLVDADAVAALLPGRDAELVADAAVEPGGAVVEVGEARIDATLTAALDRARAVLLDDATFTADPGNGPESDANFEQALRFTAGPADEDGTSS